MSTEPSNPPDDELEDFWDLGDEDQEPKLAPEKSPSPLNPPETPETKPTQKPVLTREPEVTNPTPPQPETPPAPETTKPKTTLLEKAGIAATLLILGASALWGFGTYLENAPEGNLVTFTENLPVTGQNITISSAETWWRKPIRKGPNPDLGVVGAANLIPCGRLTLQGTGNAELQIRFLDDKKNLVGDIISATIQNGKFLSSASSELEFNATNGFANIADIRAYVGGDIPPWSLVVIEGDATLAETEPIATFRLSGSYLLEDSEEE